MPDAAPLPGSERFVIVTGGPGSGKTTLLEQLRQRGHPTMPDAWRAIIQEQVGIGGHALDWDDRALFIELGLMWEIRSYRLAEADPAPLVSFDRSVVELPAMWTQLGAVPPHVDAAARRFRYRPRVFVAPPWPEIYTSDTERRQDFAHAVRVDARVRAGYEAYGYQLVPLPLVGAAERADFVLAEL